MGGQYHHELMKYCPPSYVLCVSSHFWPFTKVKFVLEKFDRNLGLADPPPQLGQNPKFFEKFDLKASLKIGAVVKFVHLFWICFDTEKNCMDYLERTITKKSYSERFFLKLKSYFILTADQTIGSQTAI